MAADTPWPWERGPALCAGCGTDTMPEDQPGEYYMLENEIWAATGMGQDGYLCIGCAETSLGRELAADDFKDARVNEPNPRTMTPRLLGRLGRRHE